MTKQELYAFAEKLADRVGGAVRSVQNEDDRGDWFSVEVVADNISIELTTYYASIVEVDGPLRIRIDTDDTVNFSTPDETLDALVDGVGPLKKVLDALVEDR